MYSRTSSRVLSVQARTTSLARVSVRAKNGGRSYYQEQARFNSSAREEVKFNFWKVGLGVGLVGGFTALIGTSIIAEEAKADYDKIRKQIAAVIDADPNRGPTLIRLAWHASGTYSKVDKTGGSDGGNIRHQPEAGHGANAGLHLARGWLEPIKKSNPGITYADLFTLAGVVAIEEMGGPKIKWRPGRSDNPDGKSSSQNTRLPDADKGKNVDTIKHIREIFNRMGFSDQEIVALLGAHSLGRCYTDRSGYSGPWTKAPTAFSNEYYRELLENTWTVKKWKGPLQYEDKAKELMMLPADMALLSDGEFKKWVEIYAKDEARFSKDFAAAFGKLLELGVKSFEKKGWWPF